MPLPSPVECALTDVRHRWTIESQVPRRAPPLSPLFLFLIDVAVAVHCTAARIVAAVVSAAVGPAAAAGAANVRPTPVAVLDFAAAAAVAVEPSLQRPLQLKQFYNAYLNLMRLICG